MVLCLIDCSVLGSIVCCLVVAVCFGCLVLVLVVLVVFVVGWLLGVVAYLLLLC